MLIERIMQIMGIIRNFTQVMTNVCTPAHAEQPFRSLTHAGHRFRYVCCRTVPSVTH